MQKGMCTLLFVLVVALTLPNTVSAQQEDKPAGQYLVRVYFDKADWESAEPDVVGHVVPERFFAESNTVQVRTATDADCTHGWCAISRGVSGVLHVDGRGKYSIDYSYFNIAQCGGGWMGNAGSTGWLDLGQPMSYAMCGGICRPFTIVVTSVDASNETGGR